MSLSLLSNFLLMGPQTISCFHLSYWFDLWPSHCLSWVQKLKIYRLSQVEEAIKNGFCGITWILNFFQVFSFLVKFNSTQFCVRLYWQTKQCWQQLSVWFDEVFSVFFCCCFWLLVSLKPGEVLFSASLLLSIISIDCQYVLLFFPPVVLTELAGCCFK